jgi:hypothetical protein
MPSSGVARVARNVDLIALAVARRGSHLALLTVARGASLRGADEGVRPYTSISARGAFLYFLCNGCGEYGDALPFSGCTSAAAMVRSPQNCFPQLHQKY